MKTRLIPDIAFALLTARLRQTLIAAVGVTFSITMFVTLLGFMNGLNGLLDNLVLNRTPHIRLFNDIKPSENQPVSQSLKYINSYHFISSIKPGNNRKELYNVGAILQALRSDSRVKGVAPKVSAQVFYNIGPIEMTGVVNGIDVVNEQNLFFFNDYVVTGKALSLRDIPNSIILGKTAAEKMLAKMGDIIQVTSNTGEQYPLKVVGFFQSGLAEIDKVQSYASLKTTQKILGKSSNFITDLQIKLYDMSLAPVLAKEYRSLFRCDAEDIQSANAQFETGSSVRSLISYAVGITLLIVSGFGIYNILNMMIYEKMDTIAILKATGFSGWDIKRIFITIALSIGFFGGLAGLFFGFLLSKIIDNIPFVTAALPTIHTYPIDYNPKYYAIATIFSLVTTYLAGWFPARKASKIDPVIIIRGK
ncbi:MAG: ABC transporter permease [Saprospiraceae bacterium]|nr:ABC transporter permease [Saprospiraceae bacterium]